MVPWNPSVRPRVIVIGGGLAGLVAARRIGLDAPGSDVLVLEGSDRVGGKLRLESVAGHRVDVGAEAMLALRPEATGLVTELGAQDDLVTPTTTSASIWSRGQMYAVPRATLTGVPGSPDGLEGLLTEAELDRLRHEQPWPAGAVTEDVSVGEYVGTRLGSAVVDRLVEPLLGGVYAGRADELSLEATMPALWKAAMSGESLVEAARRMLPPPPADAPAAPPPQRPVFAGIRGGVGRLPDLLVAGLPANVEVRTGVLVRGLDRTADGWQVLTGPTTAQEWLSADAVVVATPPSAAGRLLTGAVPEAARALGEIPTASSAVVTIAVPRAGLPTLPGSGFLVPSADGRMVKGATFSANKWAWTDSLDRDIVHLRASIGRAGEEALLQRSDDDLVSACVGEVSEAVGARLPAPVDAQVQRWGGGLPQYVIGHVGRMARVRDAVADTPGVEVCGAAYEGVGIAAVIASATGAAERLTVHLRERVTAG